MPRRIGKARSASMSSGVLKVVLRTVGRFSAGEDHEHAKLEASGEDEQRSDKAPGAGCTLADHRAGELQGERDKQTPDERERPEEGAPCAGGERAAHPPQASHTG